MNVVHTDESLAEAAEYAGIALADMPTVLGDPTHPRHRDLVGALTAGSGEPEPEPIER